MPPTTPITPSELAPSVADPITEGSTRIFAPEGNPEVGPGTKKMGEAFYNPAMGLNRDLSVLLVADYAARRGREVDFADALAGTGARSLRVANEVAGEVRVHANDANPFAVAAIERGRAANGVAPERLLASNREAHAFLAARRYDVVDLDPFGSPMPFLDAAVRATRHGGLVCVTATDTAALAGTYPRVCRRRYAADPLFNVPWRREVGLRILAGAVVRAAGRADRAAEPVLCVAHDHWMRVVAKLSDGRGAGDRAWKGLGYAWQDPDGTPRTTPHRGETPRGPDVAGPLWLGPLHDADLVARMTADADGRALAKPVATPRLLELLADESNAPPFWWDLGDMQARWGAPQPRRRDLIARLRAAGHQAGRSHIEPQAVRTTAEAAEMRRAWSDPDGKA